MSLVVLAGNPQEGSRTRGVAVEAALTVGERAGLPAPHDVIDLAGLGSAPAVAAAAAGHGGIRPTRWRWRSTCGR